MRSYQISIGVDSPITLRLANAPDNQEEMFRYLNNLLGDVSLDVATYARTRLEDARQVAASDGYILEIPNLAEPMGVSNGITDVTGHIGQRWKR